MTQRGLDFYINVDPAGATKGVDQAAKEAKRLESEYRKVSDSIGKMTAALDVQAAKVTQQEAGLSILGEKLAAARKREEELAAAVNAGGKVRAGAVEAAAQATKKLAAQYDVQTAKVKQAIQAEKQLTKDLKLAKDSQLNLADAANKARAQLEKLSNTKQQLKKSVEGINTGLSGLNSTLVSAAGAWLSFETATAGYKTLVDGETAVFNLSTSLRAANREFSNIGSVESWESTIDRLSDKLKIYSETALTGAAAKTIDMTKRLGLSSEQMENLIYLTGEASAGKFDLGDAIERTTAAMRGEAEASEALGFTLNENYVKSWYEARGQLQGAWKDLDDVQKAQIRYNIFVEQASPLIGKAGESVDTFSGALNRAKSEISDAITGSDELAESVTQIGRVVSENKDTVVGLFEVGANAASLFGNAVNFTVGSVKTLAATANLGAGGIFKLASMSATLTDALGLTTDAAEEWKSNADAAFASARDLGDQAATSYKRAKGEVDPLIASQDRLADATANLKNRYTEISKETGVTVTSMQELDAAVARGVVRYDEATGKWIGSEKEKQGAVAATERVAKAAAEQMAKADEDARKKAEVAWNRYRDTVISITDQIKQRTGALGLSQELDDLKASTLSAGDAYKFTQDRIRKLGEEAKRTAAEAKELSKAGEQEGAAKLYKEAVQYADEAKQLAGDLNKEVKDGEEIIVSQSKAYENAKNAVTEYGQLGIDILEEWKDETQEAADALNESFNFDRVEEGADDLKNKLGTVGDPLADSMATAADSAIGDLQRINDKKLNDRTVTVTVKEVTASASGSIVGAASAATGAMFSGWSDVRAGRINPGTHSMVDRIPVMTAAHEWIVTSKATKHLKDNIFHPLNRGDEEGVARALVHNFPHLEKIFAPKNELRVVVNRHGGNDTQHGMSHYHVTDPYSGRMYEKIMRDDDFNFEKNRAERFASLIGSLRR